MESAEPRKHRARRPSAVDDIAEGGYGTISRINWIEAGSLGNFVARPGLLARIRAAVSRALAAEVP
jgi:hypothetical protein